MDETTLVPIDWLFYTSGLLVLGFMWWLRHEFTKNDRQHMQGMSNVQKVHERIDHLILHLLPTHPFKDKDKD